MHRTIYGVGVADLCLFITYVQTNPPPVTARTHPNNNNNKKLFHFLAVGWTECTSITVAVHSHTRHHHHRRHRRQTTTPSTVRPVGGVCVPMNKRISFCNPRNRIVQTDRRNRMPLAAISAHSLTEVAHFESACVCVCASTIKAKKTTAAATQVEVLVGCLCEVLVIFARVASRSRQTKETNWLGRRRRRTQVLLEWEPTTEFCVVLVLFCIRHIRGISFLFLLFWGYSAVESVRTNRKFEAAHFDINFHIYRSVVCRNVIKCEEWQMASVPSVQWIVDGRQIWKSDVRHLSRPYASH